MLPNVAMSGSSELTFNPHLNLGTARANVSPQPYHLCQEAANCWPQEATQQRCGLHSMLASSDLHR